MSLELWELLEDYDFTEKQWENILKPLGNVTVTDKHRQGIILASATKGVDLTSFLLTDLAGLLGPNR